MQLVAIYSYSLVKFKIEVKALTTPSRLSALILYPSLTSTVLLHRQSDWILVLDLKAIWLALQVGGGDWLKCLRPALIAQYLSTFIHCSMGLSQTPESHSNSNSTKAACCGTAVAERFIYAGTHALSTSCLCDQRSGTTGYGIALCLSINHTGIS